MKFYTFSQNNSGGHFVFDKDRGISIYIIIEAKSKKDAINKAKNIGVYFDGVASGRDCACCGDRWSTYIDSYSEPKIYNKTLEEILNSDRTFFWKGRGKEICVHYADGRKEWY